MAKLEYGTVCGTASSDANTPYTPTCASEHLLKSDVTLEQEGVDMHRTLQKTNAMHWHC